MFGVFVIVIIVWVGSMPQPLHKQLTLHEAQAYEGASAFYRCFLPWFMLVLLLAHLISLMLDKSNYWPFAAIAGSFYCYYWALRFYTSCNQIDTTPLMPPFLSISTTEAVASQQEAGLIAAKPSRLKCKVCDIVCDYRTKHCRKCQVCVQRFDHHCFWIGNCVGRHNHKPFFLFLLLQTCNNLLNSYALYHLGPILQITSLPFPTALYCLYLLLCLMAFGFILFTGFLLLYHCMLVASAMTTWEHMRRSKITYLKHLPVGYNPFSKGVLANIAHFFSEPTRYTGQAAAVSWEQSIPTFQESKKLQPVFNLIDNQYYSCC